MDAPSHDTIDALLAELLPTTRLDERPVGADQPDRSPPDGPRGGRPGRRRWPVRLALAMVVLCLAAAAFASGVLVGRRTADGGAAVGQADVNRLGSVPGKPFGTATVQSGAGDAASTDPTGLVALYRNELAARDLVSASLSDGDLTRFGYAACVFAASAEGPADFERFRTTATAEADTTLSDAEMEVVIDTAVVVFCPVDAQRLGITA